jgi:RND family efflux transporter MFP subunit
MRVNGIRERKMPRSPLSLVLVSLAALAVPATGGRAQQVPPSPPAVTVSPPLKKQITEYHEFTGQFAPVEYVEVRARVNGYLTEIHFTDGQLVNKGDLLFSIDSRPYDIALASARANLALAAASVELANRQLSRAGELRQKDFVAQSTYDERLQQMRAAEATVDAAKAAVRDAELNLEFTRVVAPVTGRISSRQVTVGNLISGGTNGGAATLLTTIVSLNPIYVNFDMSESDYLAYRRIAASGQLAGARENNLPVQIRLVDEKAWTHQGILDFVDNQVDRGAGTIRVRAVLDNPNLFITPGQFARIRMPNSIPYDALLVPESSVVTDQSNKILLTVAADGSVVPKPVTLGPMVDDLQVVREGISADDKVIINGLLRARPGAKVTPQDGTITAAPLSKIN